jgi:uncharacterized protein (TIGR03084 family)
MTQTPDTASILADLDAEHADLDALVAPLDAAAWETPTPAEGWVVRDQISHLAYFDVAAREAITDPESFTAGLAALTDPDAWLAGTVEKGRGMAPAEVLRWWREARAELIDSARGLDPKARLPWYGPSMSALSFLSARLMETWIHGQDVADGLGVDRRPTARLRHIAHIAVRARSFNYAQRGRPVPDGEIRVELDAPDDAGTWAWGPADAPDRVTGPALDFCRVATQRRHIDDTDLCVEGPLAADWMAIAQSYAGPPGPGRRPGQFPKRRSLTTG